MPHFLEIRNYADSSLLETLTAENNKLKSIQYEDEVNGVQQIEFTVERGNVTASNLAADKIYSWHVRSQNEYGFSKWSEISKFKTASITDIDDENIPVAFNLEQNYPNPFNPVTTIKFSIPENNFTTLKIYDLLGREVATLVKNNLISGRHEVTFDGKNYSSGIYVYVLSSGDNISSKKMLLIK